MHCPSWCCWSKVSCLSALGAHAPNKRIYIQTITKNLHWSIQFIQGGSLACYRRRQNTWSQWSLLALILMIHEIPISFTICHPAQAPISPDKYILLRMVLRLWAPRVPNFCLPRTWKLGKNEQLMSVWLLRWERLLAMWRKALYPCQIQWIVSVGKKIDLTFWIRNRCSDLKFGQFKTNQKTMWKNTWNSQIN